MVSRQVGGWSIVMRAKAGSWRITAVSPHREQQWEGVQEMEGDLRLSQPAPKDVLTPAKISPLNGSRPFPNITTN